MRILLVQLPTSHLGAGERVYPLGISRLASRLKRTSEPAGLDMNLWPDPWPLLKERLLAFRPHGVALSFRNLDPLAGHRSSYLSVLRTAARLVRDLLPRTNVWAGGPAFTLFPHRLLREIPEIDAGVVGEGEKAFLRLVERQGDPTGVEGVIWRKGDRLVTNQRPPGQDLDDLPSLATDLFPPGAYLRGNRYVTAVGIESKRGCDLACSYCTYPRISGGHVRVRSPRKVVDEMHHLHDACGVESFHFTDPVVNRPPDHLREICGEMIRRRLRVSWTGFFREDLLTEESLRLYVEAGLSALYFSGDGLTERALRILGKGFRKADLFRAARIAARVGVLTVDHFLVNLPGENEDEENEARGTLERILEIHASTGTLGAVVFNTVRLYPGAPLTRRVLEKGDLPPDTDLLYPVYFNPLERSGVLHRFEGLCHTAGVFSRLGLGALPGEARP